MNYKVGDTVRVREWKDMVAEFGIDGGNIPCKAVFVPNMKQYCGKEYVITNVHKGDGIYWLRGIDRYKFSDDMLTTGNKSNLEVLRSMSLENIAAALAQMYSTTPAEVEKWLKMDAVSDKQLSFPELFTSETPKDDFSSDFLSDSKWDSLFDF